jgi:hypothetical protein
VKAAPTVIGPKALSNSFLGDLIQVCVVTRDHRRAIEGFVNLGIGPWTIRTVDTSDPSSLRGIHRGMPADFAAKVCLANSPNMNWEIIEPIRGRSIYTEFLERHGDGVQHLAFNCNGADYEERIRKFHERGYETVQRGVIFGGIDFHYFTAEDDLHTTIEIWRVPPGFAFPPPQEWVPAPPP